MVFSMESRNQKYSSMFFGSIAIFLFLVFSFFTSANAISRLGRYQNLYERFKCKFPPANSDPPLFGKTGYLSRCDAFDDPLKKIGSFNLSSELCQSLLDELLIHCRGFESKLSSPEYFLKSLKNMSAQELCQDSVIKKQHTQSDWKLLGEPTICPVMCSQYPWLCRMRILLWKVADSSGNTTKTQAIVRSSTTTAATTPIPVKVVTTTVSIPNVHPKVARKGAVSPTSTTASPLQKQFEDTLKNSLEQANHGSYKHETQEDGPVSHIRLHTAPKASSRIGAKLFILFGVFSLIFLVAGYVMFYKRKQIPLSPSMMYSNTQPTPELEDCHLLAST